ncbi:MAG: hypothetical protein H6735_01485 [Alphaproteobacteria bacterium]|nr:hypothetical protein [Alphaproteobacteria bacterium]
MLISRTLTVGLLAAVPSVALAIPTVTASGTCPGQTIFSIQGLTPNTAYGVLTSTDVGTFQVPLAAGACPGQDTDLSAVGIALQTSGLANAFGEASLSVNLPAAACGLAFQVIDTGTCQLSALGVVDACVNDGRCVPAEWSDSAYLYGYSCPTDVGEQFMVACLPFGSVSPAIWGTGTYTHDSAICGAAQHDGRITNVAGGVVTVEVAPGQAGYTGSSQNGVLSLSYGQWSCSYFFR